MPWDGANGLFPGLAIGRGMPIPWADENGLFPGLGMPGTIEGLASAGFSSAGFSSLGSGCLA
jgi:hypothetical protein